jgi:hypothetical protein
MDLQTRNIDFVKIIKMDFQILEKRENTHNGTKIKCHVLKPILEIAKLQSAMFEVLNMQFS